MADDLIPDYDRRTKIVQPSFNRARIPFRGPLESVKVNLEMEQLRYDITNIRVKLDALIQTIETVMDKIYVEGATPSSPYLAATGWKRYLEGADPDFNEDATPTTFSTILKPISDLYSMIGAFEERIRQLESQRGL